LIRTGNSFVAPPFQDPPPRLGKRIGAKNLKFFVALPQNDPKFFVDLFNVPASRKVFVQLTKDEVFSEPIPPK
jgi:hypothetical protein